MEDPDRRTFTFHGGHGRADEENSEEEGMRPPLQRRVPETGRLGRERARKRAGPLVGPQRLGGTVEI